jgi:AraC-like DNA-binding protein
MRAQHDHLEKIAQLPTWRHEPLRLALTQRGEYGCARGKVVARGKGWQVQDILCTCGPTDRVFEENHALQSVSLVLAGVFNYRSDHGGVLLSSGSVLLGNAGRPFECSHHHGMGDRCLSFQFEPDLFASIAADMGVDASMTRTHRLPPLRALAGLSWQSMQLLGARNAPANEDFAELALAWAGRTLRLGASGVVQPSRPVSARDQRRVMAVVWHVQDNLDQPVSLAGMADAASLSPFHFLRVFTRVTGLSPHQWLLRQRLIRSAQLLASTEIPVTQVALESGFTDLSNFNRTFRAEYRCTPGEFREHCLPD